MCHKNAWVEVTTGFPSLRSSGSRKLGWQALNPLQPITTTLETLQRTKASENLIANKKSKKSINMIEYEAFPYTPNFGFDWYIITLLAGMYRKMERCWEICQLPKAAGRYQLLQKNATGRWTQVKQVTLLLNGGFLTKFVGSFFCQEILVCLVIILYSFFF